MLLIYCPNCEDVIKPIPEVKRSCLCKNVKTEGNHVSGAYYEVGLTTRGQFSFDAAVETAKIDATAGKFYGFVSLLDQPDESDVNNNQDD